MPKENLSKIYSLHRYIDENGAPDKKRIFSVVDEKEKWRRHLDPDLMRNIRNQADIVRGVVDKHLGTCQECKDRYFPKEPEQQDLPEIDQ